MFNNEKIFEFDCPRGIGKTTWAIEMLKAHKVSILLISDVKVTIEHYRQKYPKLFKEGRIRPFRSSSLAGMSSKPNSCALSKSRPLIKPDRATLYLSFQGMKWKAASRYF